MNKKILILPLVVTTLGLTSCKKKEETVVDSTSIAEQLYEVSVASTKSLDNVSLSSNISSDNLKFTFHDDRLNPETLKPGHILHETYVANLQNISMQAKLQVGGFKKYTYKEGAGVYSNENLKTYLKLNDISAKGSVNYKGEFVDGVSFPYFNATANLNTSKIESLHMLLNRYNPVDPENPNYNAFLYFGAGSFKNALLKILEDLEINEAYLKEEGNIKERIEGLIKIVEGGTKRYGGFADISKIFPFIGSLLEKLTEDTIGGAGKLIDDYASGTTPTKEDSIKVIKDFVEMVNGDEGIGKLLSMTVADNKPSFTFNLGYDQINKLKEIDSFYSGSVKITINVDDSKRVSNLIVEVNGLKTCEPIVVPTKKEDRTTTISLKDANLKIESNLSYGFNFDEFASEVNRECADPLYKSILK